MNDQPPIPDPTARDEFASCPKFRMDFLRVWSFDEVGGLLILWVIATLFFSDLPRRLIWEGMIVGTAAGVVVAACSVYIQAVTIHPQKFVGYSFWGLKVVLDWPEIIAVRPIRIPGLLYLRVLSDRRKKPIWLPLFMADLPGLVAAVNESAPPENPLRLWLNTHLKL